MPDAPRHRSALLRRILHGNCTKNGSPGDPSGAPTIWREQIHVDTSGIVRSLDRGFYDKFLRFRAFSLLTGRLRETLALKDLRFDTEEPVLVISDATLQQFQDLFDDLRARFISSNEFGLDSYLSVRISARDSIGQIRSQFEREALITRKNARTAQYEYNAHWSKPLTLSSPAAVRDKINDAFRRFSATIDGLIQEVKEDWLQIKSRSKAAGMFDFDYTDADAVNLYLAVLQIADVERFVEAVFANLWERTQAQLAKIRDRITGELCQRLLQTIDDLERALGELALARATQTFLRLWRAAYERRERTWCHCGLVQSRGGGGST